MQAILRRGAKSTWALATAWATFTLLTSCLATTCWSQDSVPVTIVNFDRDVRPILEARCIHCHGPKEAKNGFRVDDHESMLAYMEPSDLESSSLWSDYLHTTDPDMLMPPAGADGTTAGLTGVELATIKLWIEEGANWDWNTLEVSVDQELEVPASAPLAARIWAFQGLFHPASVHFPVALIVISSLFVFLSFFKRSTFEPAAFHCLWIGALGAVASSVMGWSYAVHEGYGNVAALSIEAAIDRHRWLGIAVAVLALVMIPIASSARGKKAAISRRITWFLGSVLLAGGVSIVGYQGGELIYGEDHYQQEFARLFPEAFETEAVVDEDTDPTEETTEVIEDATKPADVVVVEEIVVEEIKESEPAGLPPASTEASEVEAETPAETVETDATAELTEAPVDQATTETPPVVVEEPSGSEPTIPSEPAVTAGPATEPATTEPTTSEVTPTDPATVQPPAETAETEPPKSGTELPPVVVNPPQPQGP